MFYRIDGETLCGTCAAGAEGESIRAVRPETKPVCEACGNDSAAVGESFEDRATRDMTNVDWAHEDRCIGGMDPDWYRG